MLFDYRSVFSHKKPEKAIVHFDFCECDTADRGVVARLGGRALFTFVTARALRRFPAYTSRHMARLAGRVTVDDVTTLRTTAYRYTSRAQSATREPM